LSQNCKKLRPDVWCAKMWIMLLKNYFYIFMIVCRITWYNTVFMELKSTSWTLVTLTNSLWSRKIFVLLFFTSLFRSFFWLLFFSKFGQRNKFHFILFFSMFVGGKLNQFCCQKTPPGIRWQSYKRSFVLNTKLILYSLTAHFFDQFRPQIAFHRFGQA